MNIEQIQKQRFNWIRDPEERAELRRDRDLRVMRRMIEGEINPKIYLKHLGQKNAFQITDIDNITEVNGLWPSGNEFIVIPFIPDFQYILDTFRSVDDKAWAKEAIHFLSKTNPEDSFNELMNIPFYSEVYYQLFLAEDRLSFPNWNLQLQREWNNYWGKCEVDDNAISIVAMHCNASVRYLVDEYKDLANSEYTKFTDYNNFVEANERTLIYLDEEERKRYEAFKSRIDDKANRLLLHKYNEVNNTELIYVNIEKSLDEYFEKFNQKVIRLLWRFARRLDRELYLEVNNQEYYDLIEMVDTSLSYKVEVVRDDDYRKIVKIVKINE